MPDPTIVGIHHVVLSVSDLGRSIAWYTEVLEFQELFPWNTEDFDRQLLIHPSGVILGLTQHRHTDSAAGFNARRPGLDHLSFAVADRETLDAWADKLDQAEIPHSGVKVTAETGFTLIDFRDPDGIQLELYVA